MVAYSILQGSFVSPMGGALYAHMSTHDQHTLAMQMDAMREFTIRRRNASSISFWCGNSIAGDARSST